MLVRLTALLPPSLVPVVLDQSVRIISDSGVTYTIISIRLKQIGRQCMSERSSLSAGWASTGYGDQSLFTTVVRV